MQDYANGTESPWYSEYREMIKEVVIEEGATTLGSRSFINCTNLTKVTSPATVKKVGDMVFWNGSSGATAIKELDLSNVEEFGEYALAGCSGLTTIDLSKAVTIGKGAFQDCNGLTSAVIGGTQETVVGMGAFVRCTSLSSVTFGNVTEVGTNAFEKCALKTADLSSVKTIGGKAFLDCTQLESVTFGENLESIGNNAFQGAGLKEVTVPASVTSFGTYVFKGCTALEKGVIQAALDENKKVTGAFDGCTGLKEAELPSDLKAIGAFTFRNTALEEITIPGTVTSITKSAFNNCESLKTIYFDGPRSDWEAIGYTAAEGVTVICKDDQEHVEVIGIELDKTELTITVNEEPIELTATIIPENATDRIIVWTSSNEEVVKVEDGRVIAVAEGKAEITAAIGAVSAVCKVEVLAEEDDTIADLSGYSFKYFYEYTVNDDFKTESAPIKSENGSYIVTIDYHAITYANGYYLEISSPKKTEDFSVSYTSYLQGDGTLMYSAGHPVTASSSEGELKIKDYYTVMGKPDEQLVYSELNFTVGEKTAKVILVPAVCYHNLQVKDSSGAEYPVVQNGDDSYTVSARSDTELIISITPAIRNYIKYKIRKDYLTVYVNGEKVDLNDIDYYRFTYKVGETEDSVQISLVQEDLGIQRYDYTLTFVPIALSTPILYYNGQKVTNSGIPVTTEQYEEFVLTVEGESVDENTVYRWYDLTDLSTDLGNNSPSFNFDTSIPGIHQIECQASNTIDGITYTSIPAHFTITVLPKEYPMPIIVTQPVGGEYKQGNTAENITVVIEGVENVITGRTFEFQWYQNSEQSTTGGTAVDEPHIISYYNKGGYKDSLVPETNEVGDFWYYCVIREFGTNAEGETIYSEPAVTDCVLIRVMETGIELEGRGTEDDPYLIGSYEELKQLHDLVNDGSAFNNTYFRMTADIALASDWTPMGITVDGTNNVADADNLHAFSGIFDGDGHTLTVYPGGLPLLGYIEGATVKNLNIYGERINGYGLVNNLYGVRIVGTGITVDNVTLKSGSSTLKSGLLGGEIDWQINPYSSASAHFMSYVSNCTIESGVVVGYDGSQSKIGSIAGSFNGIMENCVSYATVNGVDNVGGLVGYKDNSGGGDKFSVLNSAFYGTVNASGSNAGGIVGAGYTDITAPNAGGVNIKNCMASGTVNGNKNVGGILGGEPGIDQLWDASYIQSNYFNGKVNGNENVGAIIGYMGALDKYNFIENNTFMAGCGSEKTYGGVHMVDTSAVEEGWHDGTYYYDSSKEHTDAQWQEIFDVMWEPWQGSGRWQPSLSMNFKLNHNRDDDPLGVNGGSVTPVDPDKPRITGFTISGNYKTEYTVGDTLDLSGIVFTAAWSDGSTTNPALGEVSYSGFDSGSQGERTMIFKYGGLSATFTYKVTPKSNKITVSISILGDTVHGSPTAANKHTLKEGNLTTWVGTSYYEASTSDTVFDLLQRVFAQYGITFKGDGSYISALTFNGTNLGEFSNGTNSGWMYTVNGHHPLLSVGEQYLNDGDVIIFHYSDDYTVEEGSEGYDNTDAQAAQEVEALIEAIPTPVTPASRPAIEAAREAYDNLNYGQKAKVGNYDKLVAAEEALKAAERAEAEANATPADRAAAEAVEKLIDAIKTPVTADQADAVKAAREAYDKLTDLQKKLVDNLDKLEQAETALTSMKEEVNLRKIHSDTGDAIEAKGDLDVNGQWLAIGLARAGRKVDKEAFYASAEEYVKQEINEDEQLHWAKVTENARMVLALTALGYDPTDVAGHNLLMGMTDMEYVKMQGFNGPIWTLIAFDSNQYEIPENPDAKDQVTREKLISYLLENQLEDGGWALFGNLSDSDITGMTLQALAPYYGKRDDVTKAVDIALETLSRMQNADGSYSALGGDNGMEPTSESISQILVALSALGIDADKDPRFIKNGNSVLDALAAYYEDGGFKHVTYGKLNGMATEQAYYALTAYFRMLDGQTSLYDMTDVTVKKAEKPEQTEETADTSETSEEEDVALAVDAAEEAEEKTGISPVWIIPPMAAAGIIAFLVADRKRRKDKENAG